MIPEAKDANAQSAPPLPEVRGERAFVCAERVVRRFDGCVRRWIPDDLNPLAQSGQAANLAILVAVVTGVLMLFWYSPSTQYAYTSLEAIHGRTFGGWMRAMHRYSSDLIMLLLFVHAGRTFLARKFTGARWLPWVSGVFLISLMWFIGWTGYWLVWDQPAQQVAVTSMRFFDAVPLVGEPMSRLYVADRLVPSLLFFVVFFLHMLLPLMIAVGLVFHLARVTRVRLLPRKELAWALVAALGVVSILFPAPLDVPAEMAVKAERLTVDAWYLTPLALALRLTDAGLWLAAALTLGLAAGIPWILGRCGKPRPISAEGEVATPLSPIQTVVTQTRCHACTQCVQDCPYGAVTMLPRTDGKPFAARAYVDPVRCVGCAVCVGSCDSEAMDLPWFSVKAEEEAILAAADERTEKGEAPWIALVAGDIDGGLPYFRRRVWEDRLPGYAVYFVPTASWVRPRFVEKLFRRGAAGVLIVHDTAAESPARDGNAWPLARMEGTREPHFRPARAGIASESWRVLPYDPGSAGAFRRAAAEFRKGGTPEVRGKTAAGPGQWRASAAVGLFLAILTGAVVTPSHLEVSNPTPAHPEFVFSFKVFGDPEAVAELDPEADSARPVHMRGRVTEKPARHPVTVRLVLDGEAHEPSFRAKGVSRDGPAIDQIRLPLEPGRWVDARVELRRGPESEPEVWTGSFPARERRLHVLTYEPGEGFRFEP